MRAAAGYRFVVPKEHRFAASGTLQPNCAHQPANPSEIVLIRQVQVAISISQGYATVMSSNQAGVAEWQSPA